MLVLFGVLAVASAVLLLFRYSRWQNAGNELPRSFPDDPPANARPLFAPTDEELRLETEAKAARFIARREYKARAKLRVKVDEALANWRVAKDGKGAAQLLRVTAEHGLEGDFSRAADEIIHAFRASGVDGLDAKDLAALLDSHYRLLPAAERSSGELFWLKNEIGRLAEHS